MKHSTESSIISMQYVVRIVITVTVLFALLLVIDPPISVVGWILSALVMSLLVTAVLLLRRALGTDNPIIQNLFR